MNEPITNDAQLRSTKQYVAKLRGIREAMRERFKGTPLLPMALEGCTANIELLEHEIAEYEVKCARENAAYRYPMIGF